MKNELIVTAADADRSIDSLMRNVLSLVRRFDADEVVEARTKSGLLYKHNVETGIKTVAVPGAMLEMTPTMLTLRMSVPGASQDATLADLSGATQEQRGAVLGRSQPWVSQRVKQVNNETNETEE